MAAEPEEVNAVDERVRTELALENDLEKANAEIERLRKELAAATETLRRAKDPTPIQRPSWQRVIRLVHDACMSLSRVASGWELSLGSLKRRFRSLKQIWEILVQEEWSLSDVFPPLPEGKARPRKPKRYPVLAPWLPFVSIAESQHTDDVDTSAPAEDWVFELY